MGNQLTGIAPSQILPVEQYLADIGDYEYQTSLGSTRFFKVARAKYKEGQLVVKVFVIHDPSLPLQSHKHKLEEIVQRLKSTSNCLPFQKAIQSDKAGLIFRQYVKDSLYDRISTRPFLNMIEKKWIAFQLLCALNQCHRVKVFHGDIKSENVMITGWTWLLLTDFASFKPTYLPEDNPSDFSYFFDTSRRRTCYIAPERFIEGGWRNQEAAGNANNIDLTSSEIKIGDLTPAMDIFSAGCVITELFTDGTTPFDLSQLLAYRSGEYSPWKILEKIPDQHVRELVRHMIQKDPKHRLSAEEYLVKQRGKAFPEYFYTFLKIYLQQFAASPIIPADDRVTLIKRDLPSLLKNMKIDENKPENNVGLVLIISCVGSCCRNLHFCNARVLALELLLELSQYVTSDIILDRIIPYMLYFVSDSFPRVRGETISTVTRCLANIRNIPRSDGNVFPEYIFPNLSNLVHDEVVMVRAAYAENIAHLSETALSVLEMTQLCKLTEAHSTDDSSDNVQYEMESSYDSELQTLQTIIQQKVVTLLSDPDNTVKQTLLESGITRLCVFFGRQKASDVLLSHMITFLNDKYDWQLRGSFFDNIVGVAAYIGWQSSAMLKPLLQQGLSDPEEYVLHKALGALKALAELGLLQKSMLQEFVQEIVPFLSHPGIWVRHGAVGFISAMATILNIADIHCYLLPQITPFLKHKVLQIDKEIVLLNALDECIPRPVFDYILRSSSVDSVLTVLHNRKKVRSMSRQCSSPPYEALDSSMTQVFRKLTSLGMNENHEVKLLAMKDYVIKVHRARSGSNENSADLDSSKKGSLNLTSLNARQRNITRRHADLHKSYSEKTNETHTSPTSRRRKKMTPSEPISAAMNEDWKKMFGSMDTDRSASLKNKTPEKHDTLDKKSSSSTLNMSSQSSSSSIVNVSQSVGISNEGSTQLEKGIRYANCKWELRNLVHKRREQYVTDVQTKDLLEGIAWDSRPPPDNWKPKGQLVAHLQEHRAAVNRIQVCQDHSYFASCSNDGSVKLWECSRLEGKSVLNRSKHTFSKQGGRIKSITFCENSTALASASDNGTIQVYKLDEMRSKAVKDIDVDTYGNITDITHFDTGKSASLIIFHYFDTGSQSILTYSTVNGFIVGWDLRSPEPAWKLKNEPRAGLITSFAVHQTQCWLAAGTSNGTHICWDMRFQLRIGLNTIQHPAQARVRRLIMHPHEQSLILSAPQWNNEVSMWDVETGSRQKVLWASKSPPLSLNQTNNHAIHGMHIASTDQKIFLLTAGTDMTIRYWDLATPTKSFIMSHPTTEYTNTAVSYQSQLIDGTDVVQEVYNRKQTSSEDIPHRGPEAPSTAHHNMISDISICQSSQCLVITASRDGVIKLWK